MNRRVLICLTFEAVVASSTATFAYAQPVLLVGNVKLADGANPSEVRIQGKYSGRQGDLRTPARDIYVYQLPAAETTIRLTFGMNGYDLQAIDVTPERIYASRVADIVLTKVKIPPDGGSQDDDGESEHQVRALRVHLESQATIADRAGAAFVDIFQWNLAQYRVSLRDKPALKAELESFSVSPAYSRIASPAANPKIERYRKVIETRSGISSNLQAGEALGLASDPRSSGPVRAAAVDALVGMNLSAAEKSRVLSLLRNTATATQSHSLLSSSFVGLTKLGDANDQRNVIRSTTSLSPDRVSAAFSAIAITKIVDADSLTGAVIKTNPNPAVRAAVLDNVAQREPDAKTSAAQTKVISEVLNTDTSTAVKLRAIEALSTVSAAPDTAASRQARRALEAVAADTTRPELRRAAIRAVRRPR